MKSWNKTTRLMANLTSKKSEQTLVRLTEVRDLLGLNTDSETLRFCITFTYRSMKEILEKKNKEANKDNF
jgi:hypothetical protein